MVWFTLSFMLDIDHTVQAILFYSYASTQCGTTCIDSTAVNLHWPHESTTIQRVTNQL